MKKEQKLLNAIKIYVWNLRPWVEVFNSRNKKTKFEFISYSLSVDYRFTLTKELEV